MGITETHLPLEERAGLLERAGFPEEAQKLRDAPSPTMKGETLLPDMKVGLEFPKEGKEVTPTLEGSPLMEAARKVEIEKVQPGLGLTEPQIDEFPTKEMIKEARDAHEAALGEKATDRNHQSLSSPIFVEVQLADQD
jgi:hypothetical protein